MVRLKSNKYDHMSWLINKCLYVPISGVDFLTTMYKLKKMTIVDRKKVVYMKIW